MPWTPGFQTTDPGVDEARLDAVAALMTAKLADLKTALQRGGLLPAAVTDAVQVLVGDPDSIGPVGTCPIVFCVMGGGKAGALDVEMDWLYISGPGVAVTTWRNRFYTQVRGYVHNDLFPVASSSWANITAQCTKRERLMARLCDWFRADVAAQVAAVDLALASKETREAGDELAMGQIKEIRKGRFDKACGGQVSVPGVEMLLQHILN